MLGIPIKKSSLLVGDNMPIILNTTFLFSPLKKKHLGCAYNHVHEAIATGIIDYAHVPYEENLADIFMKLLPAHIFHALMNQYLFRRPKPPMPKEYHDSKKSPMIEGEL